MIKILRKEKNGTVRMLTSEYMNCPECNGILVIDGEFSTGEKLQNDYQPQEGELIKNHTMYCRECNFNQQS